LPVNEWIGCAVGILLVSALLSLMLWVSGHERHIPHQRLKRMVAMVWVSVVACIGGLLLVRHELGGGVFDYTSQGVSPFSMRPLHGAEWGWTIGGVVWVLVWMTVALNLARRITGPGGRKMDQATDEED
jgi:hypothetical protein